MATIGFVMASHTGHVHSTFKLARELQQRGDRIFYLGEEAISDKVNEQGFPFEPAPFLRSLSSSTRWNEARGWREWRETRRRTHVRLGSLAAVPGAVVSLVDRQRPDLLIFDPFCLAYYIPFSEHGIPALSLSTKPLLDFDPLVPPYTSTLVPRGDLQGRVQV